MRVRQIRTPLSLSGRLVFDQMVAEGNGPCEWHLHRGVKWKSSHALISRAHHSLWRCILPAYNSINMLIASHTAPARQAPARDEILGCQRARRFSTLHGRRMQPVRRGRTAQCTDCDSPGVKTLMTICCEGSKMSHYKYSFTLNAANEFVIGMHFQINCHLLYIYYFFTNIFQRHSFSIKLDKNGGQMKSSK